MIRMTLLAAAVAAVACKGADRSDLASRAREAGAGVESTMTAKADSALGAARSTTNTGTETGTAKDTGIGGAAPSAPAADSGAPTSGAATGGAAAGGTSLNLSSDQVKELQTALNGAGCSAGPVDGVVGSQTRQGIACGMQKNNITGDDMKALYKSLNLNFGG